MRMKTKQGFLWCAGLVLGFPAALPVRSADATDVQRQLQQRDQQQMELRLKMQQQLDRAARPGQAPSGELRLRQLDRDQQQRLQQLHELQTRGMVPPVAPGGAEQMRRELERERALKAGADQLNRFGSQRQLETIDTGSGP